MKHQLHGFIQAPTCRRHQPPNSPQTPTRWKNQLPVYRLQTTLEKETPIHFNWYPLYLIPIFFSPLQPSIFLTHATLFFLLTLKQYTYTNMLLSLISTQAHSHPLSLHHKNFWTLKVALTNTILSSHLT